MDKVFAVLDNKVFRFLNFVLYFAALWMAFDAIFQIIGWWILAVVIVPMVIVSFVEVQTPSLKKLTESSAVVYSYLLLGVGMVISTSPFAVYVIGMSVVIRLGLYWLYDKYKRPVNLDKIY